MCLPGCQEKVLKRLNRRGFLRSAVTTAAGAVVAGCAINVTQPISTQLTAESKFSFSRVVDLTHTMVPNFPTYGGQPQLEVENVFALENDGFNLNVWHLNEHTGTHMDAPFHFADSSAWTADMIPVENLVLPLAVVDIRQKTTEDPDAQVTPDDLRAWEADHGPLPERACVAMYSGWEAFVSDDKFRNADEDSVMHFPGFHVEAIEFLLEERSALAIAVDTLSLDHGPSADFAVHYRWLPENRWGMENVANLGELPAVGATIVAGSPKIQGATGGPSRVIALV